MKNPLLANQTPATQLIFSVLLIIACFIVTLLLGILIAIPLFNVDLFSSFAVLNDYADPKSIALLKYLQIVQSFGLFIIPPILAGFFFERSSAGYLRMDRSSVLPVYLITLVIMFASLPLVNWMVVANEAMRLPQFLGGVEGWMKATEDEASRLTEAFLSTGTIGGFLVNMLMIAILPAIGEEFLFRGLIQRLLAEWTKNIHVAIFLSALLFGAMHMQFYGIFPRMMLGVLFGYLFWWTGSIWVPVFAHFINNAAAVIAAYLAGRKIIGTGYEDFGATDNIFIILLSALVTGVLLYFAYKKSVTDPG